MSDSFELWTVERINALAPDSQIRKSAQSLAQPAKWQDTGRQANLIWGEHQGSGSVPYRVVVDLDAPALKCTCPSHKQPCKHALGMFLAAQSSPKAFQTANTPEWVRQWMANRQAVAARKAKAGEDKPVDEKAQARRVAKRDKRVDQGIESLTLWMDDLIRQGLGGLASQPHSFWETQAARLVDAQAPGLARRVREMETLIHSGADWHARMLDRLSRIHLLLEAYQGIGALSPELQEEVRTQIGWTQDQAILRAKQGLRDEWGVVGAREVDEHQLRVRRTWLWGLGTHRAALIVEFAQPNRAFETVLPVGVALDAELVYWPGAAPQRALVKQADSGKRIDHLSGYGSLRDALVDWGSALTRSPWLDYFLMPLENVIPYRLDESWVVCDAQNNYLRLSLADNDGWRLMAMSGGHPLTIIGEWNGETLTPLSLLGSVVPGLEGLAGLGGPP